MNKTITFCAAVLILLCWT